MMAWSNSMLFTLNAPRAYLPFSAFANKSVVCVSGIVFQFEPRAFANQARHCWKPVGKKEHKITATHGGALDRLSTVDFPKAVAHTRSLFETLNTNIITMPNP